MTEIPLDLKIKKFFDSLSFFYILLRFKMAKKKDPVTNAIKASQIYARYQLDKALIKRGLPPTV